MGQYSPKEKKEAWKKHQNTIAKARHKDFKSGQFSVRLGRKKSFLSPGCDLNSEIYEFAKNRLPDVKGLKNIRGLKKDEIKWLCKHQFSPKLQFREDNHRVQNHDIRLFIEGAEVTQFIRGPVTWKIETTGGMNVCDFTLNNNHDAFVITPRNICAGTNKKGWRVNLRGRDIISQPGRLNRRDNEGAKYLIYRRKYNIVAPGTKEAEVDDSSGMWLYPLSPYTSIINKHDAVRLFIRMPHVSGVTRIRKKDTNQHWDLWIPAFTGFVNTYNWEDNPVIGDRSMNVSCYDYRGLMARMRVRTGGSPMATKGGAKKVGNKTQRGGHPSQNVSFPLLKSTNVLNSQEEKELKRLGVMALLSRIYHNRVNLGFLKDCNLRSVSGTTSQKECKRRVLAFAKKKTVSVAKDMTKNLALFDKRVPFFTAVEGRTATIDLSKNADKLVVKKGEKKGSKKGDIQLLEEIQKEIGDGSFNPSKLVDCGTATTANALIVDSTKRFFSPQVEVLLKKLFTIDCGLKIGKKSTNELFDFIKNSSLDEVSDLLKRFETIRDTSFFIIKSTFNSFAKNRGMLRLQLTNRIKKKVLLLSKFTKTLLKDLFFKGVLRDVTERNIQKYGRLFKEAIHKLRKFNSLDKQETILNRLFQQLRAEDIQLKAQLAAFTGNDVSLARLSNKFTTLRKQQNIRRALARASSPRVKGAGNIGAIYLNEPTFDTKQAKLFGDLIKDIEAHTHPLATMSFEQAVKWLVTSQSQILPGRILEIANYNKKGLIEEWNKTVIFGDWGRPLTFDEVTLMGINTNGDLDNNPFSPINVYLHFMLPSRVSAVGTIVQQDVGANPGNATSYQYETRKSLLDQICELLDYQWYVTPAGDIAFEFPHYNIFPVDFGVQFKNAYVVDRELISSNIAEEATDIPTAWVITGLEIDAQIDKATKTPVAENQFRKITIMIPTLARRLGVKVEHININLPGVGSVLGDAGRAGGQLALEVWGMFHIQRQIGLRHQVSVRHAFRPYLLPNRPLHLVSRQRIGLIQSVSYSMEPPGGACTTETTLGYMRWLFRDGSFRNAIGGLRYPIDYSGFFSGARTVKLREGVGHTTAVVAEPLPLGGDNFDVSTTRPKEPSKANTSHSVRGAIADNKQRGLSRTSNQIRGIAQSTRKVGDKTSGSGGTSAQKGSSLQAGVAPGKTSKTQKPPSTSSNLAGRMIRRSPPTKQGRQNVIDYSRSNMTSTGKKNPNQNKKGDGRGNRYDLNKLFYDPLPFGKWEKGTRRRSAHNQWGYAREGSSNSNHWQPHKEVWHPGVDIFVPMKTKCFAPIDLINLKAYLTIGKGQGKARGRISTVTIGFEYVKEGTTDRIYSGVKTQYIPYIIDPTTKASFIKATAGKKPKEIDLSNIHALQREVKVRSNGKPTKNALKVQVWSSRFAIAAAHNFQIPTSTTGSSARGLVLTGDGEVNIPKGSSDPRFKGDQGKLRCQVRYMHLHSIGKGLNSNNPKKAGYYGVHIRSAKADKNQERAIAFVGNSGTGVTHLHFEMLVYATPNLQSDANVNSVRAFREVLKANKEFLTRVLLAKLAGNRFRAKPTDKLSKLWKNRLIRKGKLVIPETAKKTNRKKISIPVDINNLTVLDVAKHLIKHTFKNSFQSKTDESRFISKTKTGYKSNRGTLVNPLFFFKPEELVDLRKIRPMMNQSVLSGRYKDTGAGRGRNTTVVHGICKKLTNTGLQSNYKRHIIDRAELNRTAGTTATLSGQSQAQRRDAFRRNNKEFKATEHDYLRTIDAVEDHKYDSRVSSRIEFENKINRNSNNRFDEHLKIRPTLPNPDDYNMFG